MAFIVSTVSIVSIEYVRTYSAVPSKTAFLIVQHGVSVLANDMGFSPVASGACPVAARKSYAKRSREKNNACIHICLESRYRGWLDACGLTLYHSPPIPNNSSSLLPLSLSCSSRSLAPLALSLLSLAPLSRSSLSRSLSLSIALALPPSFALPLPPSPPPSLPPSLPPYSLYLSLYLSISDLSAILVTCVASTRISARNCGALSPLLQEKRYSGRMGRTTGTGAGE
jgi:hypothetical protein